MESVDLSELSA